MKRLKRMSTPLLHTMLTVAVAAALLLIPCPVLAYGGPGSVITGIGALLAAAAAVAAAVVGFLWYPMKRLLHRIRDDGDAEAVMAEAGKESGTE